MAATLWPTGTHEKTATPMVDATGAITCDTEGAMFKYSYMTVEEHDECDRVGANGFRDSHTGWSPLNMGIETEEYVSFRNGNTYTGYLWGGILGETDYNLVTLFFRGFVPGSTVFISEDGTFMELFLPSVSPICYDTRDGMWNGETQTWDGVDPKTGEWTVTPVSVWNDEAGTWNFEALEDYVFGSARDAIYSGVGSAGFRGDKTPLNKGYNPAPMYWAMPDFDPINKPTFFSQTEFWLLSGWSFEESSFFRTEDGGGGVTTKAGSYFIGLLIRVDNLNFSAVDITFNSYDLECPF